VTVLGEHDEPVEAGESGELVVSGPTVTPGYYGDRGEDAFCAYGLRTGDIGYRTEDGSLFVVNRIDDRITSGGETIDPGEIVAVLTDHEAIEAAAVVGVPDEQWGERVTALVVPAADNLTATAVDSHCREHLAGFKCPKTIAFSEELPRTASGSIDRPAVREILTAADDAAAVVESVDTDAAGDSDDETATIAERRPPPASPAAGDSSPSSPPDSEPIPEAESTDEETAATDGDAAVDENDISDADDASDDAAADTVSTDEPEAVDTDSEREVDGDIEDTGPA